MDFEEVWRFFLEGQLQSAQGVRRERLKKDLVGEKRMFREVLWPVFQTFDGFTLEYEIKSLSGATIFVDAFYHPFRWAFESEGFVPHAESITRERFSFERMRIRTLALYGYKYIPFSWDELDQRSESCRRAVFELLGRYSASSDQAIQGLTVYERELIRFAIGLNRPFRLPDVGYCLRVGTDTSRKVLKGLLDKGLIRPLGQGMQKIRCYELDERARDCLL